MISEKKEEIDYLTTNDSRPSSAFLRQKEFTINAAKGQQLNIFLPSLRHKKNCTTYALRDERNQRAATKQLLTSLIAPLIQLLMLDFV